MNYNISLQSKSQIAVFSVLAILFFSSIAFCNETALMLQKSPEDGGSITPDSGIHRFGYDSEVALSAIPETGYQFLYWIGDVADATSSRTVVFVDSPKIIIAVFERVDNKLPKIISAASSSSQGILTGRAADYVRQGGSGGGGKRPQKYYPPVLKRPEWEWPDGEEPGDDLFPVPDGSGQDNTIPIPDGQVPEPASGMLLLLGVFVSRKMFRRKK